MMLLCSASAVLLARDAHVAPAPACAREAETAGTQCLIYLASARHVHYPLCGGRRGAGACRGPSPECWLAGPPWRAGVSKTRYGRSGELRIAYELRGRMRRRPWLVLIQGMGLDRFGWEPVLRKLRRRFRLVLVDNRASGLSGRPVGVFAVADMAADIVAVLDAAGIRRAHVMGASLGGMVAQELAVDHPERVDGLVLACTTPGWPSAYPMPQASMRLIAATAGMTAELALRRHTENALSARTVQHRPELVGRLVELQGSRPADPAALRAQATAGAMYAGRRRQTRIRARTLVLHGAADTVVDPRNAELLADRIPGARLVIFPELGHLLVRKSDFSWARGIPRWRGSATGGGGGGSGGCGQQLAGVWVDGLDGDVVAEAFEAADVVAGLAADVHALFVIAGAEVLVAGAGVREQGMEDGQDGVAGGDEGFLFGHALDKPPVFGAEE